MDAPLRNLLKRMTQDARQLLQEEFGGQLEGVFDILPNGDLPEAPGSHLSAADAALGVRLAAAIRHRRAKQQEAPAESVRSFVRECAFTFLNRLVALKMLEARGLVRECVSKGEESAGFKEFGILAAGLSATPDKGYRLYLECIFDEIGREVGVLFDSRDPVAQLWPARPQLIRVLGLINDPNLASVWREDETIGWVYQYFNLDEERREMRQNQAPQNSREMAVRNQFFTPRYVVEFLTDNTLGRLWYEMRQGQTEVASRCTYLVRRKHPIFLKPDATPPEPFTRRPEGWWANPEKEMWLRPNPDLGDVQTIWQYAITSSGCDYALQTWGTECADLANGRLEEYKQSGAWCGTFEELRCCLFFEQRRYRHFGCEPEGEDLKAVLDLHQAVCRAWDLETEIVPHREPKDPRDLKILDPACGSGHFLLYCFDLLEIIYKEAWDAGVGSLRSSFETWEGLQREIPKLVLRHNLHGVDIDARAAQIASLALWMRAQRAWKDLPRGGRPEIHRTNIAIAEPMPGEPEILDEFCADQNPVLARLIRQVFEKMKLAGDAGTLLRIESDIADIVADARREWVSEATPTDRTGNPLLFATSNQRTIFEAQEIGGDFWETAEARLFDALRRYARSASNGKAFLRRLFADDAERGFAFIDICRQHYDVMLMNPPFGEACAPSQAYIDENYGDTKGDVYKAFVEGSWDRLLHDGMLGIISNRTGFFLNQSQDWRERVVLRLYHPQFLADLGDGVLDAMVETAAYTLRKIGVAEEADLALTLAADLRELAAAGDAIFSIPKYARQRAGLKRHQAVQELEWLERDGLIVAVPGHFKRWQIVASRLSTVAVPTPKPPSTLVCIRLLKGDDKQTPLREAIEGCSRGVRAQSVFSVDPSAFSLVPGAPFAYWVEDSIRRLFRGFPALEGEGRSARVGLQTSDDFRFVRAWWEVPEVRLLTGTSQTSQDEFRRMTYLGKFWAPFAKGGAYSPYYADLYLTVNWGEDGRELRAFNKSKVQNDSWYFRPGLTWPRRTTSGLSVRQFPAGAVFADKGPAIFCDGNLMNMVGLLQSSTVAALVELQVAAAGAAARSYEVGIIQRLPIPASAMAPEVNALGEGASLVLNLKQLLDSADELSHVFTGPAILRFGGTLPQRAAAVRRVISESELVIARQRHALNSVSAELYSVPEPPESAASIPQELARDGDAEDEEQDNVTSQDTDTVAADLISFSVGCTFGRWNPRPWGGTLPDPFAPLPSHAPAAEGASAIGDGILIDELGHPTDLGSAIEAWFTRTFGGDSGRMLQETTEALAGHDGDLRRWLAASFFEFHVGRYSKKPRKAPIYWQLSIPSRRWSVWLYYHRLTKDTLWRVLKYTEAKLEGEDGRYANMVAQAGSAPNSTQRRAIDDQKNFVEELTRFRTEVDTVAQVWDPDLNDGVLLNFAPLRNLVPQFPAWQRELEENWRSLCEGKYDWSRLAMRLWPGRVLEKCATERSLAIAHGLEETFWEPLEDGKWKKRKVGAADLKQLLAERTSDAVRDALERLTTAGSGNGAVGAGRRRRAARSNS